MTIPTGISVGANSSAAGEVGDEHEHARRSRPRAGSSALRRRRAAEPAREVRRDERDERRSGPAADDRDAGQHDRGGEQRQPRALDAEPERAGEVVAELERVERGGASDEQRRREHARARRRAARRAPSRGR